MGVLSLFSALLRPIANVVPLSQILTIIVGIYLSVLILLNLIPHVRVRSLGWLALCGVKISLPEATITIKKVYVKVNVWKSSAPFRMITFQFSGVVVVVKNDVPGEKTEQQDSFQDLPMAKEGVSFLVPKLVADLVFKRNWLNELSVQFYHVSFYHHAIHDNVSLHLDYVKIENTCDLQNATEKFTISILDGYVNDTSQGSDLAGMKIFHNLEFCIKCDFVASCPPKSTRKLQIDLTNFDLLLVLGHLRICKLAQLLEKRKKQKGTERKSRPPPSLQYILAKFNSIAAVSLKIEQSEVQFKEVVVSSSSYSLNYLKDNSFKQSTVAKISSYVTAARLFHLDSQCMDLPSLTYILNIDLSDFYRAAQSENKDKFTVDLATTLSVTNPSISVFFDQFAYLLDLPSSGESRAKSGNESFNFRAYSPHVRKSSVKFVMVDLKGQLHMPKAEKGEFRRQALDNVVSTAGAQVLAFKFSSKNLGSLLSRKSPSSSAITLKSFLKIRNMYVEVEENKILLSGLSALIGYCLDSHKIALRISTNKFQLKSVNTMIFHVIRRIREASITSSNRACAKMNRAEEAGTEPLSNDDAKKELLDIFEILPPIIHSIKFRSRIFSSYIVCNDFLPSHVIHDESLGEDIDLATFKRGVSFSANGLEVDYKRQDETFEARLKQVTANTLSEYSSEYMGDFDKEKSDPLGEIDASDASSLESGLSGFSSYEDSENVKTVKEVLNIEDIILRNPSGNRNKLLLSVPQVEGRADIYLVWCILYARTLVEMIAPQVEKTYSKEEAKRLKRGAKTVDLDMEIASLSLVTRLPHDVDILFEIDNLHLRNGLVSPHCQISYLRLYVVHPTTKLWSRLVSVTDVDVDFDMVSKKSILLNTRAFRFNIPFQFLVYTVIDNVITFFKAARQIGDNFQHLSKNIEDYSRIGPKAMEPLHIPRIQFKSDVMGITLENDDFEAELAVIFQFGAIENVERRRKMAAFTKKADALRAHTRETLSKEHVDYRRFVGKSTHKHRTNVLTKALFKTYDKDHESTKDVKKSSLRQTVCGGDCDHEGKEASTCPKITTFLGAFGSADSKRTSSSMRDSSKDKVSTNEDITVEADTRMTEEETEALISEAYDSLLEDFSNSWVYKYQRFKSSYHQSWKKRMENIWGADKINKLMKSTFDIQEYSRGPPQFHGSFRDLDLTIDDPHLGDVHEFLHKYGKGQPHLEYSILIPAYVHLKSSSVYMALRDYPLPFISFPNSGDPDSPVMDLKGNFVINEKLVQIREELREIFVPFSPATRASRIVDNFYSVCVIRTLTPVKVMFDVESNLATDRACVISWCKAYSAALSSAMMAFENFTKPEIDDSPLGWWDKTALNAHGKVRFNIENELCLHMKSSLSPYSLIGNSSGLVFCWKDNISLRINDTGKHSELVILQSDDFILGIPNYSATEGRAWSLMNQSSEKSKDYGEAETEKFQKIVMKLTSDEKVTWKLGFLFERNRDKNAKELSANMERTNKFKPHYDVTVTGPQYDYHPDSFEKFRSDYTHLAISVNSSSQRGNSHNYAYFTPVTFAYFKVWWNSLTDNVSLPIREGKLFIKSAFKDSSLKWGPHLFTIKYQLVIEPLTISHIFLSSGAKETNHNVLAYGLKGKASKCAIDLHQRREFARYVNEKLGIDKKVRKLKMNLGEVSLSEADIRLLYASFNDISMTGKLLSYYAGETRKAVDLDTYESEIKEQNMKNQARRRGLIVEDNDFSWIDFDDFIEIEHDILSPDVSVKVLPFVNTPRFTYFREFTLEHPEGLHPFGREPSHDCLIGVDSPDEIQTQLVELRSTEVKFKLNEYLKKAKKLAQSGDPKHKKEMLQIDKEIAHMQTKVHSLRQIREKIDSDSHPSSLNLNSHCISNVNSRATSRSGSIAEIKPQKSRALSVYTAISSLDQAREVINTNSVLSSYHNRFLIHDLKMRWNNEVRDTFTSFLSVVGHIKTEELAMSRKALELMDKLLKSTEQVRRESVAEPSFVSENKFECGDDIIAAFEEYLTSTIGDTEEIVPKYLVKFIKPQVHFQSDANPTACVLMTSRDIELRVFCVNQEGTDDIITETDEDTSLLETRYGVLCSDSRVLAFQEDEFPIKSKDPYGIDNNRESWPPWLSLEDKDDLESYNKNLVIEKTTIAFSLKKPNMLAVETNKEYERKSELVVHMAKLVINATSVQYCAFYYIVTNLLIHETQKHYFLQRIEQISSVTEASDYASLSDRIKLLQNNISICRFLILKMSEKSLKLSEEKRRQHSHLKMELCRMRIELCIIIKSLESKSSTDSGLKAMSKVWSVMIDQLIFHILDDSRQPLVDFALATSKFTRSEEADGSNANTVNVSLLQGFNLQRDVVYPELLRPFTEKKDEKHTGETYDSSKPMITMGWKMLNPVGGIRVMSNAELSVQPMQIQLDYATATKLFEYLFPKDEDKSHNGNGNEAKDDTSSTEGSESDAGYDSLESPATSQSPSHTFKKLWRRSKLNTSESSSIFTRTSPTKETVSTESMSMTSSEGPASQERSLSTRDRSTNGNHLKKKPAKPTKKIPDDISLIMNRSAQYFVVGDFRVNKTKLCISMKAPKHLNIIDVHNLVFSLPEIHYRDKTWTSNDFVMQLKRDVVKIFLSNTGKIIGNKFKVKHRKRTSTPLRQIADFSKYTTLEDLQENGVARDDQSISERLHGNTAQSSLRTPSISVRQLTDERRQLHM